jgi:hypothetical protein
MKKFKFTLVFIFFSISMFLQTKVETERGFAIRAH